ncbi:MFS transporter [Nonomuraea sp. SBT364]|uniref:MFS transporter n=1 Tax=Nonomuraea sp. SBT364 TaxID=1580530 RepID=UPI00069F86D8|nr:MFS transporter [Nonomuraea sp. SBT364]
MPLSLFFFLDGVVFATWVVRIPAVKDHLGATTGGLGVALMCMSIGTGLAMTVSGRLCARYGTRPVILAAIALVSLALPLVALPGTVPALCVALAVTGLCYGTVNIGLNSAAVEVEQATRRPVMSVLHGLWSAGGLAGALLGGLVATRLSTMQHFLLVCALVLACTAALARPLLRAGVPAASASPGARRPFGLIVVLCGVLAVCAAFGEGAVADWSVLHLRDDLHAEASLAAYGFSAYSVAIALARLAGSRLVRRFGQTAVLVTGALLAVCGILAASWTGSVAVALGGFVAVGLGLANVFPLAIARAGALGGPSGVGLASSIGHAGMLGGPPLIGFLAEHIGLADALTVVAVSSGAIVPLAVCLRTGSSRKALA